MYLLLGCTDEEAYNFDINANTNDGSCEPFIFVQPNTIGSQVPSSVFANSL